MVHAICGFPAGLPLKTLDNPEKSGGLISMGSVHTSAWMYVISAGLA